MDKKCRVLVVGLGKRGKHHAVAFQADPDFEVVGLCDVNPAALAASADTLGMKHLPQSTDAAALAKTLKPDVFCFCTMPNLRYDMVTLAVDCGARLVAFEKPVALSMHEAIRLKGLIDRSGIKAVVSHQHRYGPHYQKVAEIAADGSLGRIQMVYASATGWMTHMMSHMVDYLRWYNGNVPAAWVMGQAAGKGKLTDNHPSPDYVAGVIQFANGVRGHVECGAGAPDQPDVAKWWGKNRIGIQGTTGFAEVLTNGGWRAVTRDGVASGEGAMNYDRDMPPYIRDMAIWLHGGAPHPCAFGEAYQGCEIVMGILRSAALGGQVALPLDDGPEELALLAGKLPDRPVIANPANLAEYPGAVTVA